MTLSPFLISTELHLMNVASNFLKVIRVDHVEVSRTKKGLYDGLFQST